MSLRIFMTWGVALLLLGCGNGGNAEDSTDSTDETTGGPTPDSHAVAECEAMFACSCESLPFASLDACIETRSAQLAALASVAEQRGLTWDAACAQARIDRLTAGCADAFAAADHCTAEYCPLYVGTKPDGSECDEFGRAELISDCASGSVCRIGSCHAYCRVFADGELCDDNFLGAACPEGQSCIVVDIGGTCGTPPGEGDYCSQIGPTCGPGLVCDYDNSECRTRPGLGDPCFPNWCVEGAYCEVDVCVASKPTGEACSANGECQTNFCAANVCTALPDQVGASCAESSACAEGLQCNFMDLTCVLLEPATCTFAANGCAVEFNGECDEQAGGGVCAADDDHHDCGYCPQMWTSNDFCNEDWGTCPPGSDPEC